MRGNEAFALDIIQRLHQMYPNWKMNVKYDTDRRMGQRGRSFQHPAPQAPFYGGQGYPPPPQNYPPQHHYPPAQNYRPNRSYQQFQQQQNMAMHPEHLEGSKPCNIMVRELWLGGIPENCDRGLLHQVMSYYGIVEDIEVFPKFAFVKYKQVHEATTAFERADELVQRLGGPYGFRIFFSDPARRAYIVSNNYEFDKHSPSLPILFIGFPPITSARVEMDVMRNVVSNFGEIKNEYMRRNTNGQNRSYFLFTLDSVRSALRAKQELSRRKDMLGDKRAELALLMDEEVVMKGRDFSYTEKNYQGEAKRGYHEPNRSHMMPQPPHQNYQQQGYPPPPPSNYDGRTLPPQHYYPPPPPPPGYPHQPYYYDQQNPYYKPEGQHHSSEANDSENVHDFLKNVLAEKDDPTHEKKPTKGEVGKEQDILSELLGSEAKVEKKEEAREHKSRGDEKEPSWSGFLTWKGAKRVGVDGFSGSSEMEDYVVNIVSLVEVKDMELKEKSTMVLEPSNPISLKVFREYIRQLGGRVGVAFNSKYLMYVMPKCPEADAMDPISEDELLLVMEKASSLTLIKDKLIKCEELA